MTYFGCFFWTLTKNELLLHTRGINFPPRPKTMAKGTAMGLWKGKKGSSVFYRIKNSNSLQKQGIRERAYDIANPRTTSQAGQRMKMLPAQRVYGALAPVISRAWQGEEYGVKSKQAFLKCALKLTTGYPFIEKDSSVAIPGSYQISKGTLQQVTTRPSAEGDPNTHDTSLKAAYTGEEETMGDIYSGLLAGSPYLRDGDQITIVGCYQTTNDEILWEYFSFIIDSKSTAQIIDIPHFASSNNTLYWNIDTTLGGVIIKTSQTFMLASAVIISRLSDGAYLRSTSVLTINDQAGSMQNYFNGVAFRRARNSYMNPTRVQSTDWPVEPEIPENSYISDYALSGLTGAKASANGIVVKVTRNEETDALTGVFVTTYLGGDALVKKSDGTAVTYEATSGGETQILPITPADQADLANLPTIPYE